MKQCGCVNPDKMHSVYLDSGSHPFPVARTCFSPIAGILEVNLLARQAARQVADLE